MGLDPAKVDALRQLDHDGRLMARLRDAFDRTANRQRAELLAAAATPEQRRRAAHTLQAAAAQLGAGALAAHCARLEQLPQLQVGDAARLDQLLAETRAELEKL